MLKSGEVRYYIPNLIQDYVISQLSENSIKRNHSDIGDYYWNLADSFDTTTPKTIESYRLAFYHYNKSDNEEKKQYVFLRFKDKLLEQAREFFSNRYFFYAWKYYNEIYIGKYAELTPNDLSAYLESETILKKKEEDTKKKFDLAFEEYPENINLLTVYAKYLFYQRQYEEAKKVCEKLIDKFPSKNHKINNLYPNVLYSLNEIEKSILKVTSWIEQLENMPKNPAIIMQLYTNYLFYSNVIASNLNLGTLIRQVFYSLTKCNIPALEYIEKLDKYTNYTDVILYHYNKLIEDTKSKKHFSSYIEYLNNKKHFSNISVLKETFSDILKDNLSDEDEDFYDFQVESESSNVATQIKTMIINKSFPYIIENKILSLNEIMIEIDDYKNIIQNSINVLKKALSLETKKFGKARFSYINRLKHLEYLINLKNIVVACYKQEKSEKHILFVEGKTDRQILEKAIELFSDNLELLNIKECKGTNLAFNELISWVHNPEKKNEKAIILLDNDKSGLKTKSDLQLDKKFSIERDKKRVSIIILPKPRHILNFYQKGVFTTRQPDGNLKREFEYSIEHLFPVSCWKYAQKNNWLEEIKDLRKISYLVNLPMEQSLKDYFISMDIPENELLYITHKVKVSAKEDFANYVCNLNKNTCKEIFENFIPLVNKIDLFFNSESKEI